MSVLLALIAFSVVMIVLSTLVVAIVQLIHQARGVRQRHMKYFVGAMFDEYLWPNFGNLIDDDAGRIVRATDSKKLTEQTTGQQVLRWLISILDLPRFWSSLTPPFSSGSIELLGFKFGMFAYRILGVLVWLMLICIAYWLVDRGAVIPLTVLALALLWLVDRHRESGREAFPLLDEIVRFHSGNKAQITADLEDIKDAEDAGQLPEDERLAELYRKARMRRRFVEEMVKFSKSMAADAGRDKSASIDKLTVTDFTSQLARTEFGEAIRIAAKDKLEVVITEMARRFDQTGQESTTNFRESARKWSVAVAFVLAIGANVDAIRLLETFYRDPDLAQKVDAKYQGELDEMSRRLEVAATLANNAVGNPEGVGSAEAEVEDLKQKIKELRGSVKEDINGLAALSLPIGWNYFPYCVPMEISDLSASDAIGAEVIYPDETCRKIARDKSKGTTSARYQESEGLWGIVSDLLGDHVILHFNAAKLWFEHREKQGFSAWLAGVLLGGALIGLGGPFWFDLYKRLSAVAQIARSLGMKPGKAAGGSGHEAEIDESRSDHAPAGAVDAFEKSLEAQKILDDAAASQRAFAVMANVSELESEDEQNE